MILKEKHKEFTVKCFARYMKTSDTVDAFIEEFSEDIPKPEPRKQQQDIHQYNYEVQQQQRSIRTKLYYQLRRYNITNKEFPQKYRELFNKTRKEFLTCFIIDEFKNEDNISNELVTIYGLIKQRLFQYKNSDQTINNAKLAHNLLNTIATFNTNNPPIPKKE